MSSSSDYVSVEDAGKLLGVSARTIRNWISAGKLPAISSNRGRLVARADVLRIGALTGKVPEVPEKDSVSDRSSDASSSEVPEVALATAREQLEAIRDEWLAPLVAQISEQAVTIGRLEERLEQERQRVAALQAQIKAGDPEKDELIARLHRRVSELADQLDAAESAARDGRVDALDARLRALEAEQAESLEPAPSAPETATGAATCRAKKPRQRKWWLRLFGIDE